MSVTAGSVFPVDGGHVRVALGAFGTKLTVDGSRGTGTVELRDYERAELIRMLGGTP